jgi:hypothetical protein
MAEIPIVKSLEQLPLRAILAFAVRCARRVQPLLIADPMLRGQGKFNIRPSFDLAEKIVRGEIVSLDTQGIAAFPVVREFLCHILCEEIKVASAAELALKSAAFAALAATELVAVPTEVLEAEVPSRIKAAIRIAEVGVRERERSLQHVAAFVGVGESLLYLVADDPVRFYAANAFAYGRFAVGAATEDKRTVESYENGAQRDQVKINSLNLGDATEVGEPIDPSESGPLGPLWPDGEPKWFKNTSGEALSAYFDLAEFSDKEIVATLSLLSDLYRSIGGDELVIKRTGTLDPSTVLTPAES